MERTVVVTYQFRAREGSFCELLRYTKAVQAAAKRSEVGC